MILSGYVYLCFRVCGGRGTFRETAFAVFYVFSLVGPFGTISMDVREVTGSSVVNIDSLYSLYVFPVLIAVHDATGWRRWISVLLVFGLLAAISALVLLASSPH
jgi:hypothetical protein